MTKIRLSAWLVVASCLWTTGCSYRLAGPMQDRSRTIAIPVFANKSLRPNLESCLTEKLVALFAASNGGRVVPQDRAELELTGSVLSYSTGAVAYTGSDAAAAYQASMSADAAMRNRSTGVILWQGTVQAFQDYPANNDLNLQLNAEEAARSELCRKLAEQILRKSGEAF